MICVDYVFGSDWLVECVVYYGWVDDVIVVNL